MSARITRSRKLTLPTFAASLGLGLLTAVALLTNPLLADSSAAQTSPWHDFAPENWVNSTSVNASVQLHASLVHPTAIYSVSVDSGTSWFGPTPATVVPLSSNEWHLQSLQVPFWDGENNRIRFAVAAGIQRFASPVYPVRVDNSDPELAVLAPVAGAVISGTRLVARGTVTDPLSGIDVIQVRLGNQTETPTLNAPTWTCTWPLPAADGVQYELAASAWDTATNAVTVTVPITVDNLSPTNPTTVTETHGIQNGAILTSPRSLSFRWSGAQDGGGIAGYQVTWGTDSSGISVFITMTACFTTTPVTQPGQYYLRLAAVDIAGNKAPHVNLFSIWYRPPSTTIYLPGVQRGLVWTYYEPNDTLGTAYGPLAPNILYEAFIWPAGNQDYYSIQVTNPSTNIDITLNHFPAGADFDLYLYDSVTATLPVASSAHVGSVPEHINYDPLAAKEYFIRVYPDQGASQQVPYHLKAIFQ